MEKERFAYLDSLSGIFIIFMVFHHCYFLIPNGQYIYDLLFPFCYYFMPWFFFKSGMVFNPKRDTSIFTLLIHKVKRLLVPYFFYGVIGLFVYCLSLYLQNNLHRNIFGFIVDRLIYTGAMPGNEPLWFLLSLFIVCSIYYCLCRMVNRSHLLFLVILFGCFAFFLDYLEIYSIIGNVCIGSFFFGLGYLYGKKIEIPFVLLCFLCLVYAALWLLAPSVVSVFQNKTINGYYLVWLLSSLVGIILSLNIAIHFLSNSSFLSFVGRISMTILVLHVPIINIFRLVLF